MAVNTYQNIRRKFIENCLRNTRRKYTKEELLRCLNEEMEKSFPGKTIAERTFNEDLKFLKSELALLGSDIKSWREGTQNYYQYLHPEISVFQEFTKSEMNKLVRAVHMLRQIKGIDLNDELFDVLLKLDKDVKGERHHSKNAIDLRHVVASIGYEYVDDLYDAIIEETPVEMVYKPFTEEARTVCIHPYYLKQYNSRWFLFGYDESRSDVSTLALDRIQKIKALRKTYMPPDGIFDADDYLKNIIGVTRYADRPVEDIVLQFSANRAPYILTKPLHPTQEVMEKSEDGCVTIRLQLIQNFELESLLLSFGKDVKVLQPEVLVNNIKIQANSILQSY